MRKRWWIVLIILLLFVAVIVYVLGYSGELWRTIRCIGHVGYDLRIGIHIAITPPF